MALLVPELLFWQGRAKINIATVLILAKERLSEIWDLLLCACRSYYVSAIFF